MPTLETYDFLRVNQEKQLRTRVSNILSSYSYYSDILAEMLQNAVDAVDEKHYRDPENAVAEIRIEFNVQYRKIVITDTGTGISWDMLKNAPSPDTSFKENTHLGTRRSRGEKGEGLAFLTFACNHLNIRTCDGTHTIEATVSEANNWAHERDNAPKPQIIPAYTEPLEVSEELGSTSYTRIEMSDIRTMDYSQRDIFDLSMSELIYVLRTRTAIGHVSKVVSGEAPVPNINVSLVFTSADGTQTEGTVPYLYMSPEEYLTEGSKVQYADFQRLRTQAKLHRAQGKALVYRQVKTTQGGREIKCYAFAMAVKAFEDITQDKREADQYAPDDWSGIYIATRGMPTGIKVEPRTSSGYWRRVLVLLEDDEMRFDVGRKTLQGQAKPMMQSVADMVWSDIKDYLYALTPAPVESVTRANIATRQQLFSEALHDWPNLDFDAISFAREPQREQMVVALFYELVGGGYLRGYQTLRNNSRDQYDAFIRYQIDKSEIGHLQLSGVSGKTINDQIIVEFKQTAFQVLKDITENKKDYRDIDLLVCWDITQDQLENAGIDVEVIAPESVYFYGSTHKLYFPGIYPMKQDLTVIELNTLVNSLRSGKSSE